MNNAGIAWNSPIGPSDRAMDVDRLRRHPWEPVMLTFVVVLSLVLATAALGAVSGTGAGLAVVLFIAGIAAGVALSLADEDSIASPSA